MFLKRNPILRLLLPMVVGIILQWYTQAPILYGIAVWLVAGVSFFILGINNQFKIWESLHWRGAAIVLAGVATGMLLIWMKDPRHNKEWLGKHYQPGNLVMVTLSEPLVSKERSYKVNASVQSIIKNKKRIRASGNIIIYFKKDSINKTLSPGDVLCIGGRLQEINNPGNPGDFDYKRYSLFNGITHQVYLTHKDYYKFPGNQLPWYKKLLLGAKSYVLNAIKLYVKGTKEQGLAEAMLIGYKDDLDKHLLQSYTNTGVVHVIAVSGMHLALLYWIFNLLLSPLLRYSKARWMYALCMLGFLWFFAFLTGGGASIIRAAVMFSFITVGKQLRRNVSTYNLLAASAFFQLSYNPYWLWDVGFQLSYAAVLSIVIFYRSIYNLWHVKNKIHNAIWQLAAVSMAAQILTTPISIYYFHQFPIYFLLNNLVVVPVSTAVLVATLVLVLISPIKIVAAFIGYLLNGLIWWLNTFIERMESLPMAIWSGLDINLVQSVLLFIIIAGVSFGLMYKRKAAMVGALVGLFLFFTIRAISFYHAERQHRIIVYNANRYSATDFINGRAYYFYGNPALLNDTALSNYVLAPSRIKYRVSATGRLNGLYHNGNAFVFGGKNILFMNDYVKELPGAAKLEADLVILSGNSKLYIPGLLKHITPKQIVIDASVPFWKARYWKQDCDSLKIACHDVATEGAFVMNLH